MSRTESVFRSCCHTAAWCFVGLTLWNCLTIYSWLHPALWAVGLMMFFVLEALLFVLKVERRTLPDPLVLAMWASIAAWFSLEYAFVTMTSIMLLRLFPAGWVIRVGSVFLAVAVLSLMSWADVNPWSDHPGSKATLIAFRSTCSVCAFLLLFYACLPARAQK